MTRMYSSKWIFWTQNVWTCVVVALGGLFLAKCNWPLWLAIPVCVVSAAILWQIGIGLISLMDYNHRMAVKYNIKIENLPLYNSIFDEMVKKEEQGIDTSGIPDGISDEQEWLRFCRWQLERELAKAKVSYGSSSAHNEYMIVNGINYFAELCDDDKIGRIDAPGFKQTYDRIIGGILTQVVSTQDDLQKFGNKLYSKNFYPISIHTKAEVMKHINSVIEEVAQTSKHGRNIRMKAQKNLGLLFNAYVSVMYIHEEATRSIEELQKRAND